MTKFSLPRRGGIVDVLVDESDLDRVMAAGPWRILETLSRRGTVYVQRNVTRDGKRTTEYLHRFVLDAPRGLQVDHINRDGLDNRQQNLRLATSSENRYNTAQYSNNKCGLKGVHKCRRSGLWRASVQAQGRAVELGRFDSPEEAHAAYRRAAQVLHGAFVRFGADPDEGEAPLHNDDELLRPKRSAG